ncbi:MAG TPA: DUF3298 and DUF4163 domain-containing protein [Niallia sp.]|nr:DUF3298 and DUF4163 domain-containing protein [Niallia sp.]
MQSSKMLFRVLIIIQIFVMISNPIIADAINSPNIVVTKKYKNIDALKYPYLASAPNNVSQTKINKTLVSHIENSYLSYKEVLEQQENIKDDPKCLEYPSTCIYEYLTTYKVKYNKNNYLSILYNDYRFTGGAHGNTLISTYNFDVKSGERLLLDNFIQSEKNYAVVTNYVQDYARKHPDIFYADSSEWKNFKVTKDTNFYLADEGLFLIFQQYEVGPYVSGNPTVLIPRYLYEK